MTTYGLPITESWLPRLVDWRLQDYGSESRSPTNQSATTYEFPGCRWIATITFPECDNDMRAAHDAFWARIRGRANRLSTGHPMRPLPRGTLRAGNLTSGVAQGDTVLSIAGSGTLLPGDMIGVGGILVMATTPLAGGLVEVSPPLRSGASGGTPLVLVRPATTWLVAQPPSIIYGDGYMAPEYSVNIIEWWVT